MPKFLDTPVWYDESGILREPFDAKKMDEIAIGINANASSGSNEIAIGKNAKTGGEGNISIGANASSDSIGGITNYSIAIGYGVTAGRNATVNRPISIGYGANACYNDSIAIGSNAKSNANNSISIGANSNSTYENCIAIGVNANATSSNNSMPTIAIGSGARATLLRSISIGSNAYAGGNSQIVIGAEANGNSNSGNITIGTNALNPRTSGNRLTLLGNVDLPMDLQLGNATVTTITGSSDSRLKEDIEPVDTSRCLEDVNRLPVKRYKYKDFVGVENDIHRTGWLADDVELVFPKNVSKSDMKYPVLDGNGERQYDENGDLITFEMKDVKSICMQEALPTLWAAVQELSKRNAQLEARIVELERK